MAEVTGPVSRVEIVVDDEGDEFHSAEEGLVSPKPTQMPSVDGSPVEAAEPLTREEQLKEVGKLVDFYFGDENFAKDRFLRTKAREDPEGWIPLNLISSFKRVRKITEDQDVVIECAKSSDIVLYDEATNRVKRRLELPVNPKDALYLSAVLENLPADASLKNLEGFCGEVGVKPTKIVVYRNIDAKELSEIKHLMDDDGKGIKGKPHPLFDPDVTKQRPKPSGPIAIATFGTADECTLACAAISGTRGDWRSGILACPLCKKEKRSRRKKKQNPNGDDIWSDYSGAEDSSNPASDNERLPTVPKPLPSFSGREGRSKSPRQGRAASPDWPRRSPAPREFTRSPLAVGISPRSPQRSPLHSPSTSRANLFDRSRAPRSQFLETKSPVERWRARSASPSWRPGARSDSPSMHGSEGVTRMPLGPDGTTGFSRGRGKPIATE